MLAALVFAALVFGAAPLAAQTARPPDGAAQEGAPARIAPTRDVRLATLFGQNVVDAKGRALGRLDDVVLDLNNDRVVRLLVDAQGEVREIEVDALRPRDRGLEVVSRAGSRDAPAPPDHARAHQLLGTAVRDVDGAPLGRIEDVVVDIDGLGVRYALVGVPGPSGERLVPLPVRSFTRQGTGGFRASLAREKLDAAPAFTPDAWPRLGDPAWQARLRAWFANVPVRDATTVKSNQG